MRNDRTTRRPPPSPGEPLSLRAGEGDGGPASTAAPRAPSRAELKAQIRSDHHAIKAQCSSGPLLDAGTKIDAMVTGPKRAQRRLAIEVLTDIQSGQPYPANAAALAEKVAAYRAYQRGMGYRAFEAFVRLGAGLGALVGSIPGAVLGSAACCCCCEPSVFEDVLIVGVGTGICVGATAAGVTGLVVSTPLEFVDHARGTIGTGTGFGPLRVLRETFPVFEGGPAREEPAPGAAPGALAPAGTRSAEPARAPGLDRAPHASRGPVTAVDAPERAGTADAARTALAGILAAIPPGHRPIRRVAIAGAGPAGLAAAIRLRMAGVQRVTIYEKRGKDFSRLIRFNLREGAVTALREMGVRLTDVHDIRKLVYENRVGRGYIARALGGGDRTLGGTEPEAMLGESSTHQVSIQAIQRALLERARALGVEVHFHRELCVQRECGRRFYVALARRSDLPAGIPAALRLDGGAQPDLVIAADGDRSGIRAAHGIALIERPGESSHFIAGTVRWGRFDGKIRRLLEETPEGERHRTIAIGVKGDAETWLLAEVPLSLDPGGDEERQRDFYLTQARKVIPDARFLEIGELKGQFAVKQGAAERSFAFDEDNGIPVLLVGQASRTGHFLGSAGFVLAVTDDARRVEAFVRAQNDRVHPTDRRAAFASFEQGARAAAAAWHRLGADEFGSNEVPINLGRDFRELADADRDGVPLGRAARQIAWHGGSVMLVSRLGWAGVASNVRTRLTGLEGAVERFFVDLDPDLALEGEIQLEAERRADQTWPARVAAARANAAHTR